MQQQGVISLFHRLNTDFNFIHAVNESENQSLRTV